MGKQWKQWLILFSWALKSLWTMTAAMKFNDTCSLEEKLCQTQTAYYKAEALLCWPRSTQSKQCFSSCPLWTIQNTERGRIDAFEFRCWRRHMRLPSTARRSNQSIVKEINPEHSLEGLMLKLKFQYFGHLMWRADSLEKTLMKIEGRKRRGRQDDEMVGWHYRLNGHEFEQTPGDSEG